MTSTDTLLRVISHDGRTRATVLTTRDLIREIQRRHDMSEAVAVATGRVATSALLMSTSLKGDQLLTVEVHTEGPIGFIRATADARGGVRAYAAVETLDAGVTAESAIGTEGHFKVVKDLGFGEPYQGVVPLVKGNIAADLTYYLFSSDQVKSAVGLDEVVEGGEIVAAGAFLVQSLPSEGGHVQEELRDLALAELMADRVETLPPLRELIAREDFAEALLAHLMPEGYKDLGRIDIGFRCGCSRQRIEAGLRMVGKDELYAILDEEGGPLEVRCHFCGEVYAFAAADIDALE